MLTDNLQFIATTSEIFVDEAREEMIAAVQMLVPGAKPELKTLTSGLILLTLPREMNGSAFAKALRGLRPVFVRHIHSCDVVLPLEEKSPEILRNTLKHELTELLSSGSSQVVGETGIVPNWDLQVRKVAAKVPFSGGEVALWLRQDLASFLGGDGAAPCILSCTIVGGEIYCGLGDPRANLSSRMGGVYHYDMGRFTASRAGSKLKEATEVFSIPSHDIHQGSKGRALDLGAAPGGWTQVLVEHGYFVDAVDPGDLHSDLAKNPAVRAVKVKAQDFKPARETYDLLTCDVNWDALETAHAVVALAFSLKAGGQGIVTIKLKKGKAQPQIKAVPKVLQKEFEIRDVKLLFHNRREVTLNLVKRPSK